MQLQLGEGLVVFNVSVCCWSVIVTPSTFNSIDLLFLHFVHTTINNVQYIHKFKNITFKATMCTTIILASCGHVTQEQQRKI